MSNSCMCGALDCPRCSAAMGFSISDPDLFEADVAHEVEVKASSLAAVTEAMGSFSDEDYLKLDKLVHVALQIKFRGEPAEQSIALAAIGEHISNTVLAYFDSEARK